MRKILTLFLVLALGLSAKSQSITVTYPNGGDTMYNCDTDTIRFSASGTSTFYNIDYSVNGGTTWQSVITNIKITNGKYGWKVPITVAHTVNCLIKVYDKLAPAVKDSSDAVFNIFKPITVTWPNGGEILNGFTSQNITWNTYHNSTSDFYHIHYSLNAGSTWSPIAIFTTGNLYNWTVPSIGASNNCLIRVQDPNNTCKVDLSDAVFSIMPPLPVITSAGGGQVFRTGEFNYITWDTGSIISNKVRLDYTVDSGKTWIYIDSVSKYQGAGIGYSWEIPFHNSTKCFIKLTNNSYPSSYKVSDTAFTILPAVTIYTPFKGDTFYTCNSTVINFDRTLYLTNSFVMEYLEIGTGYWFNIDSGLITSSQPSIAYTWTLPSYLFNKPNNDFVIRIYPAGYPDYVSYSDTFHIKTSVRLITPAFDGNYKYGDTVLIKWNAEGTNNSFDIGASYKVGNNTYYDPKYIASNYVTGTNEYKWIVPNISLRGGMIGVRDNVDTCKESRMKYGYNVSKLDTTVRLLNGNGGDTVTGCSNYNITWKLNTTLSGFYQWNLYYYDAFTQESYPIVTGLNASARNYSWSVPDMDRDIVIQVSAKNTSFPYNQLVIDFSDVAVHVKNIGFKATPHDTLVCYGSTVQLNASTGYTNYAWTPKLFYISDTSIRNPVATVYYDQTYIVKAKLGTCTLTDSVRLRPIYTTTLAGITISTDAAAKCAGKPVTYTSTATNAGTNAIYKWYVNGIKKDSSYNATFTYNKFNQNDSVWCIMNSSLCVTNKSVKSNVLKVSFPYTPVIINDNLSGCNMIAYNGNVYTSSTVVKDTLKFVDGCDSVYRNMNIVVKTITPTTKNINVSGCNQVIYNGNTYTASAVVKDTVKSYQGCDSVYNVADISVNIITPFNNNINLSGCNSVTYKTKVYTTSTIVKDTVKSYQGCDSIFNTVNITINAVAPVTNNINLSGCNSVTYKTKVYTASTIVKDTVKSYQGCDSVYNTANITVNKITATTNAVNLSGCNSVTYKTNVYTTSTVVKDTVKSYQGCDSVYNVANITVVTVTPVTSTMTPSACNSYTYKSITYNTSTTVHDTLRTSAGSCDSVYLTINITVNPSISGRVYHPAKGNIPGVTILQTGSAANAYTASGSYTAPCINANSDIVLKSLKNNDISKNNGVGTLDIILTQRHILGLTKFNSPYKIIAANVNGDNGVSAIDIILMKRLILGIDTTFTSTKYGKRLWAFVDSSYVFPDTTNPFPYKDSISFTYLKSNKTNQSFIGVKLGDVDYTWNAGIPRGVNTKPVELTYSIDNEKRNSNNELSIANSQLSIPITVSNFNQLLGLQYTLHFDNEKYEFVNLAGFKNLQGFEYNAAQANATGNISMLWADSKAEAKTLEDGTDLFTLILKSKELGIRNWEATNNLQLTINNSITEVEAWDNDEERHNIIITKKQVTNPNQLTNQPINELTIYPNPSQGEVNINATNAKELLITDYLGRTIKQITNIKFTILHIKLSTGVYFVKAIYKDGEKVKKLVVE